ncbi:MAG: AAA family ATPase, partial [Sphingomicrobium sp.]
MADLFADQEPARRADAPAANAPLADRLRPKSLVEVVGQEHLTGPDGAIGRMVAAGKLSSMVLWGPPGTGKTTIARLLADAVGMRFVAISAVFS